MFNRNHALENSKLVVEEIDFCFEINGEEHHTKRFDLMKKKDGRRLVVRRGQAFQLQILLSRPFDIKADDLTILLQVEDEQVRSDDTTAKIQLSEEGNAARNGWNAVYKSQTESLVTFTITSPADCIVAKWTVQVKSTTETGAGIESSDYTHPLPIYILFNPWCENDSVYMDEATHREEYVENDDGVIFIGASDNISRKGWSYAQYDEDVLDCAVYLMKNVGMIEGRARGDPIATTRALTDAVNFGGEISQDRGVLIGRWHPPYSDGTSPMHWLGSLNILQQYYRTKQPVKYAQCWVFAGTLTSVLRALGIPCRPVSCFDSAHDSNGDLIIQINGNKSHDSIWNFHVWNEAWMTRPDLGTEYGGWQILDSTPQELSDGKFRCGPASLAAIYNAEMGLPHDVKFVFAEVNADKVYYAGPYEKIVSWDTTTVGQNISTKAIGSYSREDLTSHYKSPEGYERERETFIKALVKANSDFAKYYRNVDLNKDVKFEIQPIGDVMIGQGFEVILNIKNQSSTNFHHVTGTLDLITETYTGRVANAVKRQAFDVHLKPEQKTKVTLMVTFDDYYEKLVEQNFFRVQYEANIADIYFGLVSTPLKFKLLNPKINIVFYESDTLTLELKNPLPIVLNNGRFKVHIALQREEEIKLNQKIPVGQTAKASIKIHPKPGSYVVRAQFYSDELQYSEGYFWL